MSRLHFVRAFCVLLVLACTLSSHAAETLRDIEYAKSPEQRLLLDLYLPDKKKDAPLMVWIHGGAWRRGSKNSMPLGALVEEGWAIASVEYRLSPVAPFPAQIHDIKAAIRWLRAHSDKYGYASKRVAIAGASAGGHLVALTGISNGHKQLEGTLGKHLDQSSDVQVIIDFYGASNLQTILHQSTPHGLSVRVPALELLLGDHPDKKPEVAKLASPVTHVDANDPPLLLLHGDQDPQMPINQSHELHARYKKAGAPVRFSVVHGAAHGGKMFYDEARMKIVRNFLKKHFLK